MIKPQLKTTDIIQVYNGAPGCACGCRGTYSETERSKKLLLKKFNETTADIEIITGLDGEVIYFWDSSPTRTHTIYARPAQD